MKTYRLFLSALFSLALTLAARAYDISAYNVVWDTPSDNSSASMPLGGGDIGCNVWVEQGDLLLYLSRSGTFDENNSHLKLGRLRLHFDDQPFAAHFRQELRLQDGSISIEGSDLRIRLWVEVFRPIVHIEAEGQRARHLTASFESWRTADRPLSTRERHQCLGYSNTLPEMLPVYTRRDTMLPDAQGITWYHHNRADELITDREAQQQHLGDCLDSLWNPLRGLVFGGRLYTHGMRYLGQSQGEYASTPYTAWNYRTRRPQRQHRLDLQLEVVNHDQPSLFVGQLAAASVEPTAELWQRNVEWWQEFWQRSYIIVDPVHPGSEAWTLGRNYAIFRYQLGCNAYGQWPTKFNGSLFTYDPGYLRKEYEGQATPDFRLWGGGSFTGQNQRLIYWPMLKSGDFDMMPVQFDFYLNALPNAMLRTRRYWGHEGSSFTEQLNNNGLPIGHAYEKLWGGTGLPVQPRSEAGSTRPVVNLQGDTMRVVDHGWVTNIWIEDHYDTQLEFDKMILDYYEYTGLDIERYLPLIDAGIRFHDEHFRYWCKLLNGTELGPDGKLVMYPGSALETYHHATNASCTVAAMQSVIEQLLRHPELGTAEQRSYWQQVLDRLPEMPLREREGYMTIAPAAKWDGKVINNEIPQLYPVFPYRLFGLGRPDLQLAIDTYYHGVDKESQRATPRSTWFPDAIYAADLGLTEQAVHYLKMKLCNSKQSRFPTFWGTGDWGPDHNWGGVGMIALQEMLLQETPDGAPILFPAWPRNWDVQFRLHLSGGRVIEGEQKDGVMH